MKKRWILSQGRIIGPGKIQSYQWFASRQQRLYHRLHSFQRTIDYPS